MTPALQTAVHNLRLTVTTLLAIIGTATSLFFGHSLDGALSANPSVSAASPAINTVQVGGIEAADTPVEADDADICVLPEAWPGIVAPRALFRQHSALTVLSYAQRIRWAGLTGCPETPPRRPVTLTSLCISQT